MARERRRIDSNAISLGELFRRPMTYSVPVYQRDFAWTNDEVGTLWDDLSTSITEGRSEYFLGALTVSEDASRKVYQVIDGQQRLTVLSMIFAAIASYWKTKEDDSRYHGVFRDYLGAENRRTGEVIPKLTLNETNDNVYQKIVLNQTKIYGKDKKLWPVSNRLLSEAYENICGKIHIWLKTFDDSDSAILDLEDFLSEQVNIILIQTSDESDAFVLFETLNDRGLALAVSDLVKNYLFSLSGTYLERFKKAWTEITTLVGTENLTVFLRHSWLSEFELVREKEMYRALRSKYRGTTGARQFVEALRKKADLYAALSNTEHAYWIDLATDARELLETLLLFKVIQFRPVLLAAMETKDEKFVAKVLKMVQVISFRYTIVSSMGTGNLEKIYSDTAIAIRENKDITPKEVFQRLRPVYIDDERFKANFIEKRFSNSSIARYVLSRINNFIERDPETQVSEETGRITLEHIMPRKRGASWGSAASSSEEAEVFVERIGNLTLLEKGQNRGIANAGFFEKKKAYAKSSLAINKEVSKEDIWDIKRIEKRSKELANIAKKIWYIDY